MPVDTDAVRRARAESDVIMGVDIAGDIIAS